MDKAYFKLIETATEAVRLATAIAMNANYKEAIRKETDPIIVYACNDASRLIRELQEVVKRQIHANEISIAQ